MQCHISNSINYKGAVLEQNKFITKMVVAEIEQWCLHKLNFWQMIASII